MAEISVILPTLNERDNIINLIGSIKKILAGRDFEIVVVDDDSADETWRLVEERACGDGCVRLIRRIGRRGLTSALREGFERSNGGIVVFMDADFSMPPEKVPELVTEIEKGADIAVGSRFIEGGKDARGAGFRVHIFLSRTIYKLSSALLSSRFRDYTSGFVAIRRDVLGKLGLRGYYGEYFIDLIYRAIKRGYSIKEVPYSLVPRAKGTSKTTGSLPGFFNHGRRYLWTVIRLRFFERP